MDAFPEAKVVLSTRNPSTWYKSVKESIYNGHLLRLDPAVRIFGTLMGEIKNFDCVNDISLHPPKAKFIFKIFQFLKNFSSSRVAIQ